MTVFTFGDTNITTFEEHKRAFANTYNAGQDINHNTTTPGANPQRFSYLLGKTVDFHEDIIKQLYTTIQHHERKLQYPSTFHLKQMEMEQKIKKLEKTNELFHEQMDFLMVEEKKREDKDKYDKLKKRHDELMIELKEIENDMKFYKKVYDDSV